jgi:hypothetical protein
MLSPLPRNKRAKNPRGEEDNHGGEAKPKVKPTTSGNPTQEQPVKINRPEGSENAGGFENNPFSKL